MISPPFNIPVCVESIKEVLDSICNSITLTDIVHLEHCLSHQRHRVQMSSSYGVESGGECCQIFITASSGLILKQVPSNIACIELLVLFIPSRYSTNINVNLLEAGNVIIEYLSTFPLLSQSNW